LSECLSYNSHGIKVVIATVRSVLTTVDVQKMQEQNNKLHANCYIVFGTEQFLGALSKYYSGKDVSAPYKTRQLSYRKEDRAMRPIYGCPEKF